VARRLSVTISPDGELDRERLFAYVRAADEAGVEAVFIPETWGRDAFSLLVQLADRTDRIRLATGIVNVFSRSPAALAQQFATLDELSGGRAIAGLGTSGPWVIEHFHGVPFGRSATRLREVVQLLRMLFAREPLEYDGRIFRLERGFTLRFALLRSDIPIYLASFRPAGVRLAAEVADGWLPMMIPIERLASEIGRVREMAAGAGRDGQLVVRAPGVVTVTPDPDRARREHKRTLAFYLSRMGDFYHTHLSEMGRTEEVSSIREAWAAGGSAAGAEAVSDDLSRALAAVGSVERCIERLEEQAAAGVDLHQVTVAGIEAPELGRTFQRLVGTKP
jgi:alkanesulfonate monooxygenase SsuD/methylene tetrahydromethanopterin reductase-like flavin-dependent oxidoreductase (luciferase family)